MAIPNLQIEVTDKLSNTERNKGGFGSTGLNNNNNSKHTILKDMTPSQFETLLHDTPIAAKLHTTNSSRNSSHVIPGSFTSSPTTLPDSSFESIQLPLTSSKNNSSTCIPIDDEHLLPTCNVELSPDPFLDSETIQLQIRGNNPTQGLEMKMSDTWDNRVYITGCSQGTSARRVRNWIQRIKYSHLISINNTNITTVTQATKMITTAIQQQKKSIQIKVSPVERSNIHQDEGVPMLYFDQLSTIATHLNSIKYDLPNISPHPVPTNNRKLSLRNSTKLVKSVIKVAKTSKPAILPKNKRRGNRLTRRKLKLQEDWPVWKDSEWKQLDQYDDQNTFGPPCELPIGANVLDLLWTYMIKDDGRKKARCVCNGQHRNNNTAIFGYTFTKMLDHVASRIFWAACAAKNYVVRGADASNAFAEAPAPKIPLYVRIDTPFREWWKEKLKKPDIPDNYVMLVKKALQGHPESSRAWGILIDNILQTKFHLKPTSHENCLYIGKYKGKEILFLRQVDDFAVASEDDKLNSELINAIDSYMTIKIKDLGRLTRYNGVDIQQGKHYIKLHNETYIQKVADGHPWLKDELPTSILPLPIKSEHAYNRTLENAKPPETDKDIRNLQLEMGLNYCQGIGELIYLMVTCRPDISFPLIKLSQYSANPAREHYTALKDIFKYVLATKSDGLYFWRQCPREELPDLPIPIPTTSNYDTSNRPNDLPTTMHGAVDSDWAGDTTHRKSVSGLVIRLAGGTILYKTKYQDCIAMSSTEAEFIAACEAGKAILYIRSILDELKLPQEKATVLYIDNNGALMMGNAQQPTKRTRHMDIRKLVLKDWIQHDLLLMKRINTTDNYSDSLTKPLGRQLFYRHNDHIMGKIPPTYTHGFLPPSYESVDMSPTLNADEEQQEHLCSTEHGGVTRI